MPIKSKTDEQLMLEYASGNSTAFEELFRRYGKKLYNLFLRSLNKTEPAQDLLQECFLRVIEARGRYQPKPKKGFSNWIFTIAMNLIREKATFTCTDEEVDQVKFVHAVEKLGFKANISDKKSE